ncbi:MAG TPA: methyltransferase [Actinomycetaceae bacterium]|nr:methyltransferase [Actinomycetaceae bacterium]
MSDHYFAAEPASAEERREINLSLGGRRVTVETAAGVFSADRLDPGTAVLLGHVPPPPPYGTFVDLGCGWGPIALDLALQSPEGRVVAVDVNERARDLTARNAARLGLQNITVLEPADALSVLGPGSVDLLRSNPPIRIGKPALHELLATWFGRLAVDGRAELVVAKNLGSDSLQRWIGSELGLTCERVASSKGFRVFGVTR